MPVLTGLHAAPPGARWSKSMPTEFLHGRPSSPEELEMIRAARSRAWTTLAPWPTKYVASSLATGLTCCRSFRPKKSEAVASSSHR
jgi:hypothetical protein